MRKMSLNSNVQYLPTIGMVLLGILFVALLGVLFYDLWYRYRYVSSKSRQKKYLTLLSSGMFDEGWWYWWYHEDFGFVATRPDDEPNMDNIKEVTHWVLAGVSCYGGNVAFDIDGLSETIAQIIDEVIINE